MYHKILKSGYTQSLSYPQYYYNRYMGGLRQDIAQKKVFFAPANSPPGETLLYDFNLNVGDTLPPSYNQGQGVYVSKIDSVLVGNKYHKRFKIKPFNYWPSTDTNHAIIEGIGSTFGLYNEMVVYLESGERFSCFRHNTATYPANDCSFATGISTSIKQDFDFKIFPNPSTGIFSINFFEKFQFSVYDIYGREVFQSKSLNQSATLDMSLYPKGIYFVRGKSNDKIFSRKIVLK